MTLVAGILSARHPQTLREGVPGTRAPFLAWLGVLGLAAGSGWLGIEGARALVNDADLRAALVTATMASAGPVLVVVVVLVFLAERRWPAVERPAASRAHLVDAAYLVLFGVAVLPLLTLVQVGMEVVLQRDATFLVLGRLTPVPQWLVVGATVVAMDAMNWAAHVANHRSAALWRLHALHHSQEEMSVFTTFRTHPLAHASYLPALLPALVLGASGTVPMAVLVAYGCLVTLPHANLRWTFGPLGSVLVSPAYHRLHHARDLDPALGTVNFAFVFVCWDQLFGRAVFPRGGGSMPVPTGIAGRPVPIEQEPERGLLWVVAAQLAQPFAPGRRGAAMVPVESEIESAP